MPGSTNFQQYNPNCNNQESDAAYTGDATRANGATVGQQFPSLTGNKLFYQLAIWMSAFAQSLAGKGFSPNDGSASPGTALANLRSVFDQVLTSVDFTFTTIVAALGFTPIQQGGAASQNAAIKVRLGRDSTDVNHLRCVFGTGIGANDVGKIANLSDVPLIQWGQSSGGAIAFPVAFSGTPGISIIEFGGSCNLISVSPSGATYNFTGGGTVSWIATGPR